MKRHLGLAGIVFAVSTAFGGPAAAQDLGELLSIARAMNPELQVMALEADAAAAAVEGAGSLMDPKVTFQVEGWRRDRPSYAPRASWEGTTKTVRITQDIPFWGKRDLRREIAEAGARRAAILKQAVENEIVEKVTVAHAEYILAGRTLDLASSLRSRVDTLSKLAQARYGQGLGRQQDVTRAEVEKAMLDGEIARMEAERTNARIRLNRLLNRDLETGFDDDGDLPPVPPREAMDLIALVDRATSGNPELLADVEAIGGSDRSVALAERGWYPDFEVGVGAMREMGRWDSYEAMVTMNVPLQWGLRRSDIGEAKAMAAAARKRLESRGIDIGADVREVYWMLDASRKVERLLRENSLPQAEIGFQAAARAYELGRTEFLDVLMAEQQLWRTQLDLVRIRLEQRMQLARLEKLIGGPL